MGTNFSGIYRIIENKISIFDHMERTMYKTRRNYENIQNRLFDGVGEYRIPEIKPTQYESCDFIGFNYAKDCKNPENKGVHFFLDDYQFNRVWNDPDRYIDMLRRFKCVLSPDFSLFTDFPKALQIYNHYRKHWLAAYWQENGINVIPTVCWSTQDSFEWCFDGELTHGCVAVSAIGTQRRKADKEAFMTGYNEMLRRLEPETILFYGKVPEGCKGNIVMIPAFSDKFRKQEEK